MQRVQESRALYGIQRADQFPNINASAVSDRSRIPADLSPIGRSVISEQYSATLNLSAWELDFWGRVRNLSTAALETYLSTEEARRAVVTSLVAEVANTYLLARERDELVVIAQSTLASRAESHRIMKRRYEVGSGSKLDAVQAETLLNSARANLAVADYERTIMEAFREVADALAQRCWLAEQVAAQQATLAAQTERARLAVLRYQSGAAPYFEVLDAERDRFAAEQPVVQARRSLLSSSVNLYAALGGGTENHTGRD